MSEGELLTDILKTDQVRFPTLRAITKWARRYPEFAASLKDAKQEQCLFYADELIRLSKDSSKDMIPGPGGRLVGSTVNLQRQGLFCYNIRFILGRLHNDFKEKQVQEITGKDGGALKTENVEIVPVDRPEKENQDQWLKRVQAQRLEAKKVSSLQ